MCCGGSAAGRRKKRSGGRRGARERRCGATSSGRASSAGSQGLLDSQRVLRDLAHELLAGAGKIAKLLYPCRRHEAAADQPVSEQIGDPHRVVHVGLATGHIADVLGIGKHQLEAPLEKMPDGFPVDTRCFHRYVRAAVRFEPVGKLEQLARRGAKRSPIDRNEKSPRPAGERTLSRVVDAPISADHPTQRPTDGGKSRGKNQPATGLPLASQLAYSVSIHS
jgi:hypothetical protein